MYNAMSYLIFQELFIGSFKYTQVPINGYVDEIFYFQWRKFICVIIIYYIRVLINNRYVQITNVLWRS